MLSRPRRHPLPGVAWDGFESREWVVIFVLEQCGYTEQNVTWYELRSECMGFG
jgi:hypothetical protein